MRHYFAYSRPLNYITLQLDPFDIVASFSAVGRLLLQARLPGTRCQTISMIRRLAKTLLGDY